MTVVTLTYIGSEQEIVSGIPNTMTIETNIPATIYFTLDESTPTINSPTYVDEFEMPTGLNSVTLSAFAISADNTYSSILTQVFAPDVTRITVSRSVGMEGFVLARADTGENTPDGFDADGATARFIDVDLETLDIARSDRGYMGIEEGIRVEVGFPDPSETASFSDDDFVPFSTPEIAELFNPTAKVIVIDTRLDNDLQPTLRPFGSLHDPYKEFGGKRIREPADDSTYVSGGFIRRFYDAKNNIMVSFYFDHNEARWIKNIQELPANIVTTDNLGIQHRSSQPLVFEWIYRGRQSSI